MHQLVKGKVFLTTGAVVEFEGVDLIRINDLTMHPMTSDHPVRLVNEWDDAGVNAPNVVVVRPSMIASIMWSFDEQWSKLDADEELERLAEEELEDEVVLEALRR